MRLSENIHHLFYLGKSCWDESRKYSDENHTRNLHYEGCMAIHSTNNYKHSNSCIFHFFILVFIMFLLILILILILFQILVSIELPELKHNPLHPWFSLQIELESKHSTKYTYGLANSDDRVEDGTAGVFWVFLGSNSQEWYKDWKVRQETQ